MKRKTISMWAVIVIIAFGTVILIYPMFFNPVNDSTPVPVEEPHSSVAPQNQ